MFLLDGSGSVTQTGFDQMLGFVDFVARGMLHLGSAETDDRVGVVVYST